ncbi:MAG: DTW domain-containing protein, partial [Kangiellaceae bacterium]|nr:DTW domain-containing protein [Kangiellaceae bacterium]
RLIADSFPHNSNAFCWHRTEPPIELLNLINDSSRECAIVFPANPEQNRPLVDKLQLSKIAGKRLTLAFLDATRCQSRRMFNSSIWLTKCKVLIFVPTKKALYSSRKASDASQLSTAESARLALLHAG